MKFKKGEDGKYTLDIIGYTCPHPLLYFKEAIKKMNSGDMIKVILDYPTSMETIGAECKKKNHEVLNHTINEEVYTLEIKKA